MDLRAPEFSVDSVFLNRWSPRSFTGESIPDDVLMSLFEAARWAPSSYNYQPWRFLYAKRDSDAWSTFHGLLTEVNRVWACNASALIFILSDSIVMRPGQDAPKASYTHIFDAGAAWANLALQATLLGWCTHGMQGFDAERAHIELGIPRHFRVNAAVAVGKLGPKSNLSEVLQAREKPSDRRPLRETVAAGKFPSGAAGFDATGV